ncbi:hypothetical protein HHI36_003940 [Cryptolaemus montrouzieri]|uniref:WAC domain-containing protein n=1 Tax=Cryptolaemus montrouzieri TaxID=559131 RepID=A0ABD2NQ57_9CUCU
MPLNRNVAAKEATAFFVLTVAPLAAYEANKARVAGIDEISEIPQSPQVPTISRKKIQMETSEDDDDWVCGSAEKIILKMQRRKMIRVGAILYRRVPYLVKCQQENSNEEVFMCDTCAEKESDYDEY